MGLSNKKQSGNISAELLPTYYTPFAKDITKDSNGFNFQIAAQDGTDLFEIWYYGNLIRKKLIVSTDDALTRVVARAVSSGQEILIFDGYTHGYDNLAWQEHDDADKVERTLKKLDLGIGKVFVRTETLPDDEEEWEKDENGLVTSDHGRKYKWADFKRDAITWLSVALVTEQGKKANIIDEELA
ncbi:MAG: hypothetical protein LBT20_06135 [Clostridiales bacterium]|jgi:hypothetical protein|nr:hypothetical protein [Clostridiales bacterium]